VAVKIKLQRLGKIRQPQYRIIVADSRARRSGKAIETIGKYHPLQEPSFIEVDTERAQYWLGVGAQPTEPVQRILEITGDWQKFKGLPGAEGTLKHAEPKRDKLEIFNEALKEAASEPKGDAVTKKAASSKKKAEAQPTEAPAEAAAETPAAETPAAEAPTDLPVPASETPEGAAAEAEAAEGSPAARSES
jgi:small subunit ribosomal protein S16